MLLTSSHDIWIPMDATYLKHLLRLKHLAESILPKGESDHLFQPKINYATTVRLKATNIHQRLKNILYRIHKKYKSPFIIMRFIPPLGTMNLIKELSQITPEDGSIQLGCVSSTLLVALQNFSINRFHQVWKDDPQ